MMMIFCVSSTEALPTRTDNIEDLVELIPAPGSFSNHRFVLTEKPFELL
jgi:hypothetical protein